jgi:3-oxoacyl-[acyl-carrier protein] reductase
MLSWHAASEVGKHGVRVNRLAPDSVLTERIRRSMSEDQQMQWAAIFPLGRMGTHGEVTLATLFLASERFFWVTDVRLHVPEGKIML